MLDDDTIRKYRDQYLAQGAASLLEDNNKGTRPYLTVAQIEEMDAHLEENVYSDSKGIRAWVSKKFNVEYTASGILTLLDRMGFVYKKPVLTPCKADVEKQERFVEEYRELKNNLPEKDQIYFVDGVHPQHNTIANYGWIKKGKTKHLKTNNGRQRTNINGALNLATKHVLCVENEEINAQTMIVLLKQILKTQVFGDFKNAVNNFFENKVWLEKESENILTDNFQIIKPNFSGSYLK